MMAVFPNSVATAEQLAVAANSDIDTLIAPISAIATTITFATSGRWSSGQLVVIDSEIIFLGTVAGATATGCTRGYDGSVAATHAAGAAVYGWIVAAHHNLLSAEIVAIETALGANLANVGSALASSFNFSRPASQVIATAGLYSFNLTTLPAGVSATIAAPSYAVSNVTNNGFGLCRVTTSAFHTLRPGMVVVVAGITGAPSANGVWVISSATFTTIDLQGSVFSGVYGSGGTFQQRPHYLYLSGGSGSAEACPIVSVTGTTVQLYVQTAKSGSYTISSATGGIQEAIQGSVGSVEIDRGYVDVAATITIDGGFHGGSQISGFGALVSVLRRRAGFTVGDVIRVVNDAGPILRDFGIQNANQVLITDGAAISGRNQTNFATNVSNIRIIDERHGIELRGTNRWYISDVFYTQFPGYSALGAYAQNGILIGDGPWNSNSDIFISNSALLGVEGGSLPPGGVQLLNGLHIQQADGVYISSLSVVAAIGIQINRIDLTKNLNYVQIANATFDNCGTSACYINAGSGAAGFFQNIKFTCSAFQTTHQAGQFVFIGGNSINAGGVIFDGCYFSSSNEVMFYISDASNITINGCTVNNVNQSNNASGFLIDFQGTASTDIVISGLRCSYVPAFGDFSRGIRIACNLTRFTFSAVQMARSVTHGINLSVGYTLADSVINGAAFTGLGGFGILLAGTVNGVSIDGVAFTGNGFGSMSITGTVTRLSLGDNSYQETTQAAIASAATITLATDNFLPLVPITGATSIVTINGGWNRRQVLFRFAGAVSFTAAGNIARAFGPTVADQIVELTFDSLTGKWYPQ